MSNQDEIRIVLLDDHRLMRTGLGRLIESRSNLQVVAEGSSDADGVALVAREQPDVVVMDLDSEASLCQVSKVREVCPEARLLLLTMAADETLHHRSILLGAHGLFFKDQHPDLLLVAIEKVFNGEVWINRTMMSQLLDEIRRPEPDLSDEDKRIGDLTDREHEVIELIAQGLKNREIGKRLHISESTVRHHLTSIYSKLDVGDRLELLIFSYQHGLVVPPSVDS